jgi:hypothetical protein
MIWMIGQQLYLWNIIHCDTVTMLSCVSFNVDSFAFKASSENDMTTVGEIYFPILIDKRDSLRLYDAQQAETAVQSRAVQELIGKVVTEHYATKLVTGKIPPVSSLSVCL